MWFQTILNFLSSFCTLLFGVTVRFGFSLWIFFYLFFQFLQFRIVRLIADYFSWYTSKSICIKKTKKDIPMTGLSIEHEYMVAKTKSYMYTFINVQSGFLGILLCLYLRIYNIFIIHSNKSFDWIYFWHVYTPYHYHRIHHTNKLDMWCFCLAFLPTILFLFFWWRFFFCCRCHCSFFPVAIHMYAFQSIIIENLPQQWFQYSLGNIFISIESRTEIKWMMMVLNIICTVYALSSDKDILNEMNGHEKWKKN